MSVLQYSDSISATDLQIWNNAAFDNGGESEEPATAVKASWSSMQFMDRSDSFQSDLSKENLSPNGVRLKPPHQIGDSHGKPLKLLSKNSLYEPVSPAKTGKAKSGFRDERRIDSEIEEIENEISRLSSKLEALKFEKIERTVKTTVERRGRVVPAKFTKNSDPKRRGFSIGPAEIAARKITKPEMTPVQPVQNRRKSCVWKLQEIDERKIQPPKHAATTVGSRKVSKKEDSILNSIHPKKLFKDDEKSVTAKKPKTGRVVASRYSQIQSNGGERKRSLPDDGNEDLKRRDKRVASVVSKSWGSEIRGKKKWEINPSENATVSTPCVPKIGVEGIPRIRTNRFVKDTPRSSGAAKRVAELVGRRSVFSLEEEEASVCQVLTFEDHAEE